MSARECIDELLRDSQERLGMLAKGIALVRRGSNV